MIAWSKQWMNPDLAGPYSRAMKAATTRTAYSQTKLQFAPQVHRGATKGSVRGLFDFVVTASVLNTESVPVGILEQMFRRISVLDWGIAFVYLALILLPSGLVIFFARDRYYRRRDFESVRLTLKVR